MSNVPIARITSNPVARHNHHGQHVPLGDTIGAAVVRLDTAAACAIRRAHATAHPFDVRPLLARANEAVDRYLDGYGTTDDAIQALEAVAAELRTVGGAS